MAQISKKLVIPLKTVTMLAFDVLAFAVLALGGLVPFSVTCMAQNSVSVSSAAIDRQLHEFSESIMSPYCPGMTLSGCPSPDARTLREEVRARLEKGETQQAIKQSLVERFGPELSGLPASTGTAKAAYGVPWLIVGLGVIGALLLIRIGSRKAGTGASLGLDHVNEVGVIGGGVEKADPTAESKAAADDTLREIYSEIDAEVSRRLARGE